MLGVGLFIVASGLTIAMFATKERMLGFACTIWWAVVSGYYYSKWTIAWVDIEYFCFFAGMGMAIFTMLAAFGLRERQKGIGEEEMERRDGGYIDEGGKETDEMSESPRTRALHRRADDRRNRNK